MFITSMVLREKTEVEESVKDGHSCVFLRCSRSSCCVYSINMYFSFFSVKLYVKCIDKFRIVYFEFYAQCCSNDINVLKVHLLNMFVHYINHH